MYHWHHRERETHIDFSVLIELLFSPRFVCCVFLFFLFLCELLMCSCGSEAGCFKIKMYLIAFGVKLNKMLAWMNENQGYFAFFFVYIKCLV